MRNTGRGSAIWSRRLVCSGVPTAAGSLALSLVNTHPVARGYVHWLVDGIPPLDGELTSGGALSTGRELEPYAGPFPPSRVPTTTCSLSMRSTPRLRSRPPNAELSAFLRLIEGHVLATATLTGRFTNP